MEFTPTAVDGAYIIDLEPHIDERGFFARVFCADEFAELGLETGVAQASLSASTTRGTIRGLHWQHHPHQEAKLVRCVRGALWDVVADVRQASSTLGRYQGVELTADNRRALYLPPGTAHGFQTLEDDTEILYQMSAAYAPAFQTGIRFDDPFFEIEWPLAEQTVLQRDREFPDFTPSEHGTR